MYHPDPIIAASSAVNLERLSEPSVYMSIELGRAIDNDTAVISKRRSMRIVLAVLSAKADFINWMSNESTGIIGSGGSLLEETFCGRNGIVVTTPLDLL